MHAPLHALDTSDTVVDPTTAEQTEYEDQPEEEEELRCAACGHPITRPKLRISVNGQHGHTFVNPAGILFEIGCFSEAEGCGELGPESDEFSWFPGYSWQVAVCRSCMTHLGWRFWSSGRTFYGLILNRLN